MFSIVSILYEVLYFYHPDKIFASLKGWSIALFGGILSHGPGYIWYLMLQELREKGVLAQGIITNKLSLQHFVRHY